MDGSIMCSMCDYYVIDNVTSICIRHAPVRDEEGHGRWPIVAPTSQCGDYALCVDGAELIKRLNILKEMQ